MTTVAVYVTVVLEYGVDMARCCLRTGWAGVNNQSCGNVVDIRDNAH